MSIVRDNLLSRKGYTPYCGAERCHYRWPRTRRNDLTMQYECRCGWKSSFETEFLKRVADFNAS